MQQDPWQLAGSLSSGACEVDASEVDGEAAGEELSPLGSPPRRGPRVRLSGGERDRGYPSLEYRLELLLESPNSRSLLELRPPSKLLQLAFRTLIVLALFSPPMLMLKNFRKSKKLSWTFRQQQMQQHITIVRRKARPKPRPSQNASFTICSSGSGRGVVDVEVTRRKPLLSKKEAGSKSGSSCA